MTTYTLDALENTDREFIELVRNLRKKIETLEKEKADLLAEIDNLKEKGEAKASELENEVTVLKKEVKALETLLKVREKTRNKKEAKNEAFS